MNHRKCLWVVLLCLVCCWTAVSDASAETTAYLKLEIEGVMIEGTVTGIRDYENWIAVASFGHNVTVSLDPRTGTATSSPNHSPIRIVKAVDKASPLLYKALVRAETVTLAEIHFLRRNTENVLEPFFVVKLENGSIASLAPSFIPAAAAGSQLLETMTIAYRKITWKDTASGIEFMDEWRTTTE